MIPARCATWTARASVTISSAAASARLGIARQAVVEAAPVEQLQRDERQALRLADVVDLDDIGVPEPCDRLGLDPEPRRDGRPAPGCRRGSSSRRPGGSARAAAPCKRPPSRLRRAAGGCHSPGPPASPSGVSSGRAPEARAPPRPRSPSDRGRPLRKARAPARPRCCRPLPPAVWCRSPRSFRENRHHRHSRRAPRNPSAPNRTIHPGPTRRRPRPPSSRSSPGPPSARRRSRPSPPAVARPPPENLASIAPAVPDNGHTLQHGPRSPRLHRRAALRRGIAAIGRCWDKHS